MLLICSADIPTQFYYTSPNFVKNISFNDNHDHQFVNSMHEVMVHTVCTAVWVVTLKGHKVCGFHGDFVVSEIFIHLHIKPSSGWGGYEWT